jgi:hypothetical protein
MDGVQQANSGHPGAHGVGTSDFSFRQQFLRYDPPMGGLIATASFRRVTRLHAVVRHAVPGPGARREI